MYSCVSHPQVQLALENVLEVGPRLVGMDLQIVQQLARVLMDSHGLEQWDLVFDRARRRAGMTRYNDQIISLSRPLMQLYDEKQVRDVVLHEIAHARVGTGHGHDEMWKKEARRLGTPPRASITEGPRAPAPYVGRCPNGHEVERYRLPRGVRSCATCSKIFDHRYLLTWYRVNAVDGTKIQPSSLNARGR